jgi:hypothetical protein
MNDFGAYACKFGMGSFFNWPVIRQMYIEIHLQNKTGLFILSRLKTGGFWM